MIIAMIINAFYIPGMTAVHATLSTANVGTDQYQYLYVLIVYLNLSNQFVPVNDGLVPIIVIWGLLWTFGLTKTLGVGVLNIVRGSGVKI